MSFKEGDFLEVQYSAWRAIDNQLLSTTDEKKAKEAKIYDEHTKYGSALVILGSNTVVKGFDKELREMSLNDQKKFTLKPLDAFGERNEELVRVMPISDFRERNISPYQGMRIDLDGVTATVKSVNSGRVVVDANHPEAGREIIYEVKIIKHVSEPKEKIIAIADTYSLKPSEVKIGNKDVEIYFDDKERTKADYFHDRTANVLATIFMNLKEYEKVYLKEEYKNPLLNTEKEKTTKTE